MRNILPINLKKFLEFAVEEDVGTGDHTSLACIPDNAIRDVQLFVKQPTVIAGVEIASQIFRFFDPQLKFQSYAFDGQNLQVGDIVFRLSGNARSILQAERLVLNCMQRMSGIATLTRQYVDLIKDTGVKILDTRKTTPCFRLFEKEAVRIGGGGNHRMGLYDMMMIKDNHVDFCGSIEHAIKRALDYRQVHGLDVKIEIEARSIEEVKQILAIGRIDRIMLDNFSVDKAKETIALIDNRFEVEISGGITLETVRAYAECKPDYISVGALTHAAQSVDLSMKAV